MKYIIKEEAPIEFTEWKAKDKMYLRGNPNWDRLPTNIKNKLRENICKEQGYICCYCERSLTENDFHLEHLMPKDISKFPKKQLDYDNILCSCQLELKKGEPRHCGNNKGSWFIEQEFISPLDPGCEGKFKYTADGYISSEDETDIVTITTIKKLNLDINKLNALRQSAIEPFIEDNLSDADLTNFVTGYLKDKDNNGGRYNDFFTTIKYLFGNYAPEIT